MPTLCPLLTTTVPVQERPDVPHLHSRRPSVSPDGELVVQILSVKQRSLSSGPASKIEVRDRQGRLVAKIDHSSAPGQPLFVDQAAWTPSSRFFVYGTSQPGGHQPTHHPIYFYSRKNNKFYSLDRVVDCFITGRINLDLEDTLDTKGKSFSHHVPGLRVSGGKTDPETKTLIVDLKQVEDHLPRSKKSL